MDFPTCSHVSGFTEASQSLTGCASIAQHFRCVSVAGASVREGTLQRAAIERAVRMQWAGEHFASTGTRKNMAPHPHPTPPWDVSEGVPERLQLK